MSNYLFRYTVTDEQGRTHAQTVSVPVGGPPPTEEVIKTAADAITVQVGDAQNVNFRTLVAADTISAGVTDTVQGLASTLIASDPITVATDDTVSDLSSALTAIDGLTISLGTLSAEAIASVEASDALLVGTIDTVQALAVTLAAADPITVVTTDTVLGLASTLGVADDLSVGIDDAGALAPVEVSASDDLAVGVTDVALSVAVVVEAVDELVIAVGGTTDEVPVEVVATDIITVGTTDTVAGLASTLAVSDAITVGATDTAQALTVTQAAADVASVGTIDTVAGLASTVGVQDDLAVGVTDETSDSFFTVEASDDLAVQVGESVEPTPIEFESSDELFVSVGSIAFQPPVGVDSSDSISVGVIDTAAISLRTLGATDALGVAVTDAHASTGISSTVTDDLTTGVAEDASGFAETVAADDLGVLLADASGETVLSVTSDDVLGVRTVDTVVATAQLLSLSATDTLAPSLAEAVAFGQVGVAANDTLFVGVGEADPSTFREVAASDALSVGMVDVSVDIAVDLSASDSLGTRVTDTATREVSLASDDTLTPAINDAVITPIPVTLGANDALMVGITDARLGAIVVVLPVASDLVSLLLGEAQVRTITLSGNDNLVVGIGEHGAGLFYRTASDTLGTRIVDTGQRFEKFTSPFPPDLIIAATVGSVTKITRRVDIYEADGVTPWMLNAPFVDGNVSVDQARAERRTADLTLYNENNALRQSPNGGFWYDKIIKIYRGVIAPGGSWETQLGEFMIDGINAPHSPDTLAVTCRDYTKKLLTAKFRQPIEFPANHPIEEVVRAIAIGGGIPASRLNLPLTGRNTGRVFPFDRMAERWAAIKEVSNAYGYEVFFTKEGNLTMQPFQDPSFSVPVHTFRTGPQGNIVSYTKRTSDTRLYNHVVVSGEASDQLPVWAEAINNDPNHPTNVGRLGYRSYFFTSAFIRTTQQAQDVANMFLKTRALEQFEVSIDSIVVPWLDVGNIVTFQDPNPGVGDPTRYLFSEFSIPLTLGPMSSTAKRVTVVGT